VGYLSVFALLSFSFHATFHNHLYKHISLTFLFLHLSNDEVLCPSYWSSFICLFLSNDCSYLISPSPCLPSFYLSYYSSHSMSAHPVSLCTWIIFPHSCLPLFSLIQHTRVVWLQLCSFGLYQKLRSDHILTTTPLFCSLCAGNKIKQIKANFVLSLLSFLPPCSPSWKFLMVGIYFFLHFSSPSLISELTLSYLYY